MAFIGHPLAALGVLRFTLNGVAVVNTLWFEFAEAPTDAAIDELADDLETWWVGRFQPVLTSAMVLQEVQVYSMADPTAYTKLVAVGAGGSQPVDAAANQAAVVVTFRTANRGRSGRGRNYVAGYDQARLEDGVWTAGTVNEVQAAYEGLNADVSGSTIAVTHVVASRVTGGVERTNLLLQPVTAYVARTVPGTQRNRVS